MGEGVDQEDGKRSARNAVVHGGDWPAASGTMASVQGLIVCKIVGRTSERLWRPPRRGCDAALAGRQRLEGAAGTAALNGGFQEAREAVEVAAQFDVADQRDERLRIDELFEG